MRHGDFEPPPVLGVPRHTTPSRPVCACCIKARGVWMRLGYEGAGVRQSPRRASGEALCGRSIVSTGQLRATVRVVVMRSDHVPHTLPVDAG